MTEPVSCTDGCGKSFVLSKDGNAPPGWHRLQITGRYRCAECARELDKINLPSDQKR